MSAVVEGRVGELLDGAERQRRCAYAGTPADAAALRRRARGGELSEPHQGLYVRPAYWERLDAGGRQLHILRAFGAMHPAWVFCSFSAALAWGLPVPKRLLGCVHVAASHTAHPRAGSSVRRHRLKTDEVEMVNGLKVTSLLQTLLDCLLEASFAEGLAVADAAVRCFGVSAGEVEAYTNRAGRGRHGIAQARRVVACIDQRARNGGESIARAVMIEEGFQVPELQVAFRDPLNPAHAFRSDFCWRLDAPRSCTSGRSPASLILGDLDGLGSCRDEDLLVDPAFSRAQLSMRQRESRLAVSGLSIVRFTYADVCAPGRLARILESSGVPRAS